MKTAISIPDPVFQEAEVLAKELGISRSHLYSQAILAYLEERRGERITQALNEIYSEDSSKLDPVLAQMQYLSLAQEEW